MKRAIFSFGIVLGCGGQQAPLATPSDAPEPVEAGTNTPGPTTKDVAPSSVAPPAEPTRSSCQRDSDCTLSTFAGCCSCCPGVPHAFFKPDLEKIEAKCQTVKCPSCSDNCGPAADITTYSALCESARCVAVPR